FSPGHRDLHRIFANPTESQLAEITQFFLRQPLRKIEASPAPQLSSVALAGLDPRGGAGAQK
ncbi:hypothetical protein, partial [Sinorhizobium meliloti]|uniref:hypothetical protein n=1 Tax=Rhizobium meliloti TaxID=382 RepID=UPI001AECF2FB